MASVGATCSILIQFLHPRINLVTQYPNAKFVDCLEGLISQSREIKKLNHRDHTVIVFRHNDFPNQMVYCNEHYAKVVECEAECDYFDGATEDVGSWENAEEIVVVEAMIDNSNDGDLLDVPELNQNQDIRKKIVRLISECYQVDDDNQPAPKNIPNAQPSINQGQGIHWFPWGSRTQCQ